MRFPKSAFRVTWSKYEPTGNVMFMRLFSSNLLLCCPLSCVEIVNFINSCLFLVLLFKLHQNLHWGPRVPAAAIPLKHHLKDETFHSADCLPWGWGCGQTDLTWSAKLLWRSSQQEVFCHVCSAPITPEMLILETQISIPRKYCILVLPPGMTCFSCSVSAD